MKALLLAAAAALLNTPGEPVFGWRDGAVYAVTTQPGRVTDIALQPGEALSGTGGVAAGDTVRWVIGESESGSGPARQTHVLVKPTAAGLATNLVIATDRRVYHVELRSTAAAYMPAVAWRYPESELIALRGTPAPSAAGGGGGGAAAASAGRAPPGSGSAANPACGPGPSPAPDLSKLYFSYRIEGDAPWKPERVFDDGRRTVIDFPASVSAGDMPPLFELGPKGEDQLVNYRVVGRRMIVDGLFQAAELRMGAGRKPRTVRILRETAPR